MKAEKESYRGGPPSAGPPSLNGALVLENVSKRFGAVQALRGVTLACSSGEIHAVVGENGSGKSTLLGIASGVLSPDEGSVRIAGHPLTTASTSNALRHGLSMAYQTYSQVLELTVAENLALAALPGERPSRRAMNDWAREKLGQFGLDLLPDARTSTVSLAQRQFLEVLKALLPRPRVLLLDEPTTALAPAEVARLHELVLAQARAGVGVIYVSHRLPEILGFANRLTVLRDGESQGTHDAAAVSEGDLIALMVGRPLQLAFPPRRPPEQTRKPLLEIHGLRSRQLGPIHLDLGAGEVLGLAGAEGNGQDRFLRALAGVDSASGSVILAGQPVRLKSPAAALRAGMMLLSGERLRESLFPVLGVRSNSTIQVLRRLSRLGWVRRRSETELVLKLAGDLKIRTPSIEQPVRFLSGGNQQKVVMTRPFLREIKVLLADEPTQGVDVRSRFDIYEALRSKADEGVAMIVKSSDPLELAGLCDRVVVFSRGEVVDEIPAWELSERRIVEGIVGGPKPAPSREAIGSTSGQATARPAKVVRARSWLPLLMMAALMVAIGGYTASQSSAFLSSFNLNSLLLSALPLALVAMGQLNPLLVGGFDISVGALMALAVAVGSVVLSSGSVGMLLGGSIALLAIGLSAGLLNAFLIRKLSIPSIIATLATLSVMQGIVLLLRPVPGGSINAGFMAALTAKVGFLPIGFVAVVALAIAGDVVLHRTRSGLVLRAVGFDETSARRIGLAAGLVASRAFLLSGMFAVFAALFLAAQVGVGDARLGSNFAIMSIAAAVLGGAALTGGRGSYVGAVVGALFLALITNVLPLLGWSAAFGQIATGVLALLALIVYRGGDIAGLARDLWRSIGHERTTPDVRLESPRLTTTTRAGKAPGPDRRE